MPTVTKAQVIAQKAVPNATIIKTARGFESSVLYVLDNGSEVVSRTSATRKKDLVKDLAKLPIANVRGMEVELHDGRIYTSVIELFKYNGI